MRFADGQLQWLTIVGTFGSGKTHLASAAIFVRKRKEHGALVGTIELLDWLREGYNTGEYNRLLERYKTMRVLGLDDIGAEKPTEWAAEQLTQIIDYRKRENLATIVTTNFMMNELVSRLGKGPAGGRIASRLWDRSHADAKVVVLAAQDYRTGKQW